MQASVPEDMVGIKALILHEYGSAASFNAAMKQHVFREMGMSYNDSGDGDGDGDGGGDGDQGPAGGSGCSALCQVNASHCPCRCLAQAFTRAGLPGPLPH